MANRVAFASGDDDEDLRQLTGAFGHAVRTGVLTAWPGVALPAVGPFRQRIGDGNQPLKVIHMLNETDSPAARRTVWEIYSESWSMTDPAQRRSLFERCLHLECIYTDPATQVIGFEQLAGYMADCHARFSGLHFVLTDFQTHHDRSISHWNMMGEGGQLLLRGVSYGLYAADGKLLQMTGFFGS